MTSSISLFTFEKAGKTDCRYISHSLDSLTPLDAVDDDDDDFATPLLPDSVALVAAAGLNEDKRMVENLSSNKDEEDEDECVMTGDFCFALPADLSSLGEQL